MKEIYIAQNEIGKFDWAHPSDEQFKFTAYVREDRKVVERNGIRCCLHLSSDDAESVKSYIDSCVEMEEWHLVFDKVMSFSRGIISTTDYKSEALAFAAEYRDSFDEISAEHVRRTIEKAQRDIDTARAILDAYSTPNARCEDYREEIMERAGASIGYLLKWASDAEKSLEDFKPESAKYAKEKEKAEGYRTQHSKLVALLA